MDKSEILPISREEADIVPMPDIKTIFLGGIFLFIFLIILNAASEIIIPMVLAFVLKLVLQPIMRFTYKLHFPQTLAAFIIVVVLLFSFVAFATALSEPLASWGQKFPHSLPQLQQRFNFLSKSVKQTKKILVQAEDLTKTTSPEIVPVAVQGDNLSDKVLTSTRVFAKGMFITVVVLYFLLISGDTFLRRLVEILPKFKDKRQAVDISQRIEHDISVYLLTITIMNSVVGVATGIIMWLCGIEDPVLWGVLAFLLNYIPTIGPMIGIGIFLITGLLSIISFWTAVLPAALYLLVHMTESSIITPIILAKRFTLNPVLVIVSLIFWFWMWGVVGAVLAVPMLAIIKIICDRIQALAPFGHFLEG